MNMSIIDVGSEMPPSLLTPLDLIDVTTEGAMGANDVPKLLFLLHIFFISTSTAEKKDSMRSSKTNHNESLLV